MQGPLQAHGIYTGKEIHASTHGEGLAHEDGALSLLFRRHTALREAGYVCMRRWVGGQVGRVA